MMFVVDDGGGGGSDCDRLMVINPIASHLLFGVLINFNFRNNVPQLREILWRHTKHPLGIHQGHRWAMSRNRGTRL